MPNKKFKSVWDAIENTPADAENMKLRSELMIALTSLIKKKGWTQQQAAKQLGITQPRISDLMRGKINLFAIDALVNMLSAVGMQVTVGIHRAA